MPRKILLIGKNGQVGFALGPVLRDLGDVVAVGRSECDLRDARQIEKVVNAIEPEVIVNAAAYTAVDKAEQEPEQAWLINTDAVGTLARLSHESGALLIHYSTDYVYAGDKPSAYVESDPVGPRCVYGRSKLAGEDLIRQHCPSHVIFRTSWVYGLHGANFLKTILRLIQQRETLGVVADQHGAPTSAAMIAKITRAVMVRFLNSGPGGLPEYGTYHLAPGGETTWHGYARFIAQVAQDAGLPLSMSPEAITALSTQQYPLPAARPANSRLDTGKLKRAFAVDLPSWDVEVRQVLELLIPR